MNRARGIFGLQAGEDIKTARPSAPRASLTSAGSSPR